MNPDTAPAANSAPTPSAETSTPATDNFGFPTTDPLSTDGMSDAELEAEVDRALGLPTKSGGTNEPATTPNPATPPSGSTPPTGTPKAGDGTNPPAATPTTPEPETPPATPGIVDEPPELQAPELDFSDLWIDVQNTEGETVRLVFDPDEPDTFLPKDFMFTDDAQLFEIMEAKAEMQGLVKDRLKEYNDFEETQAAFASEQEVLTGWDSELQELIDEGHLAAPAGPPANGQQYTPEEVAADPALQAMDELFKFLASDNEKRKAAGKPLNQSLSRVLLPWQKQNNTNAEAEAIKAENARAKAQGGLVGGSSAPTGSGESQPLYKRGSARNIWQVDTSDI